MGVIKLKKPLIRFYVQADPESQYVWSGAYFHGELALENDARWNETHTEDLWCAPDLVSSDTPRESMKDGIHPCLVYGEKCKLYLWTALPSSEGKQRRGLIVSPLDKTGVEWAEEMYQTRSNRL